MDAVDNDTCTSARAQNYLLTVVVISTCKITDGTWGFLMVGLELGLLYD